MKRNLITLVGAVIIIGGVIAVNMNFNKKLDPKQAAAAETKKKTTEQDAGPYRVKFETSKGDFVVAVDPDLSPLGAEQFKDLVKSGTYDNAKFFRVVPGFVVQWGIPADPKVAAQWDKKYIKDEPVKSSNTTGTITYAKSQMPNSRTSQVFINLRDNTELDGMGFAPFGHVVEGMDVVENLNSEYGDEPTGKQGQITSQGNAYLDRAFPGLDYIKKATVLEGEEDKKSP